MVHGHEQHMLLWTQAEQNGPQQGRLRQVERARRFGERKLPHHILPRCRGAGRYIYDR
jgi:hypothetical protein